MNTHYSSLIIGHITKDTNTDHLGATVHQAGGAVLYSSAAAHALGHHAAVLTKLPDSERELLSQFSLPASDIYCAGGKSTCLMSNTYFSADKERRRCVCLSRGDTFSAQDIPDGVTADIYHLAGLVYGDYDRAMIKALSEYGDVAVDVQGFLRHVNADSGEMYFSDWEDKKEMLPFIKYLKTDAAEAEILCGTKDRARAARQLCEWGAKEVFITHSSEIIAYDGQELLTCPIRARNLSGRTGRGDTSFAAYINERLTSPLSAALLEATAAVSMKMETPGPLHGAREDIENYKKRFFSDFI